MAKKRSYKKRKKRNLIFKTLRRLGPASWLVTMFAFLFVANFAVQIYQKPTEAISFLVGTQAKTPYQTWQSYKTHFVKHSTKTISPTYLAALAQTESGGDPFASPMWGFNWRRPWNQLFSPASSSVGLFQFTKGTFEQAKKLCIHNHKVVTTSRWYRVNSCWFNALYFRFSPSDSIELASSYLTKSIFKITGGAKLSKKKIIRIASIIHLCGEGVARRYLHRSVAQGQRCGSHLISKYIRKIEKVERLFRKYHS